MKIPVRVRSFPGSDQERMDMVAAVRRHCACSPPGPAAAAEACAPHNLLAQDATLKRLVFYRRWHRAHAERA